MIRLLACVIAAVCLSGCAVRAGAAQADTASVPRIGAVETALNDLAGYAVEVLLTEDGKGLSDYDMVTGTWTDYETHWHTGQLIWGLLEAGQVLNRNDLIEDARRGGDWWVSTQYPDGHALAGLVAAAHGDRLGDLINWTTIADGTPGLFALSRVTGVSKYADVATDAGAWLWDNTRVPETLAGGEGLFYNIINPASGMVYTDWDVHTQGMSRDPDRARTEPAPLSRVARPNIEGFLFEDMCRHTGDAVWCARFLAQADNVLARQGEQGLWLDFEPNRADGSQVHPRFNLWYAEALLQAYDLSGDRRYLDGAARTARWVQSVMTKDGKLFYRTAADGTTNRAEVTGSAVAFAGILMLRLKDYGYQGFDDTLDVIADWVMANRFAADHPDPNLAGAVLNLRQKRREGRLRLIQRDVGSTFALRFLALYLRDLRGEDVNMHLNPKTP